MKRLIKIVPILLFSILLISCNKKNIETKDTITIPDTSIPTEKESETKVSKTTEIVREEYSSEIMDSYLDTLIKKTNTYYPRWNLEGFKNRWNYIDGVFLKSVIDKYNISKDEKYINFVITYVDYYINNNGYFVCPDKSRVNQIAFVDTELDSICESRILFDLYEYTSDERYKTAIEFTYDALMKYPTLENGYSYYHKVIYPYQLWLDGMYMYVPFLSRYALYKNDMTIFDTIKKQYEYMRLHMYNSDYGLYYHGYDDSKTIFWCDETTGCSKSFWLRSMGWYLASLADLLEYVPADNSNREYFVNLYKEAIDGILKYKDKDTNMFYQVIDKGNTSILISADRYLQYFNNPYIYDTEISNYLESSGSLLVAYSILKCANMSVLSEEYRTIGENIFLGTYNHSYYNHALNDICITAGLGPEDRPYRDGTMDYYLSEPVGTNDAKGVGPFIMAYLQM
jgi:unsaturated rhamnogalacturonyl hydrolase